MYITKQQMETVSRMILGGRLITRMTLHPFSGALTVAACSGGIHSGVAIIAPDGTVEYDEDA